MEDCSLSGKRQEPQSGAHERAEQPLMTVNGLCLIGAILGIVSAFFVWMSYARGYASVSHTLIERLDAMIPMSVDGFIFIGGALFLTGAIGSLITTLGGFVESLGLGVFLWGYSDWSRTMSRVDAETEVGIGVYLAILSAGLVLLSTVKPIGIGFSAKGFRSSRERFKTVCGPESIRNLPRSTDMAKAPTSFRLVISDRKWRALLLSSLLLATAFAAGSSYSRSTVEPVEEVAGGVVWKMGEGVVGSTGKSMFTMSVNDSVQTVVWNVTYPDFNLTDWAAYNLGVKQLGDLNLSLTYIHCGGRFTSGFGDAVYLICAGNSTFKDDTVYRIDYRGGPRELPKYPLTNQRSFSFVTGVYFEFHDGKMHSWISRTPSST